MNPGPNGRFMNPDRFGAGIGGLNGFRPGGLLNGPGPDFGRGPFGGAINGIPRPPGPAFNIFPPGQGGINGGFGNGIDSFTCPMGGGYLPYCPMQGFSSWQTHCCTTFFFGDPSCCFFSISIAKIIFIMICIPILIAICLVVWCVMRKSKSPRRAPTPVNNTNNALLDGENLLNLEKEPQRYERRASLPR